MKFRDAVILGLVAAWVATIAVLTPKSEIEYAKATMTDFARSFAK